MDEPTFNVIFVEQTVALQRLGVLSLLARTPWRYRLVANGLDASEHANLRALAESDSRLDFVSLPSRSMLPHGTALTWLWDYEQPGEWFCFCDSDVFAIGELTNIGDPFAEALDVFSSCSRIENDPDAVYAGFKGGATTRSPQGHPLAAAFFCAYRRSNVRAVMDQYRLGFEQYARISQIPARAQALLTELEVPFEFMDTAKLMSLAIHHSGGTLVHRDDSNLVHIGGLSGRSAEAADQESAFRLTDADLGDKRETADPTSARERSPLEKQRKKLLGRYFFEWLTWLAGNGPQPIIESTDASLIARIGAVAQGLEDIYDQHGDRLSASA